MRAFFLVNTLICFFLNLCVFSQSLKNKKHIPNRFNYASLELKEFNEWERYQSIILRSSPINYVSRSLHPIDSNTYVAHLKIKKVEKYLTDTNGNEAIMERYHYLRNGNLNSVETRFHSFGNKIPPHQDTVRRPSIILNYEYDTLSNYLTKTTSRHHGHVLQNELKSCNSANLITFRFDDDLTLKEKINIDKFGNTICKEIFHVSEKKLINKIDFIFYDVLEYSYIYKYYYYE